MESDSEEEPYIQMKSSQMDSMSKQISQLVQSDPFNIFNGLFYVDF